VAAAAALLALAPTVAGGAPLRAAANSVTYQDSVGEDPLAADISSVTVSNTDAGVITFQISVTNKPTYTPDLYFAVFVDTDNNPNTGDPTLRGVDYVIELARGEVNLFRWDGTDFTRRFGDPPAVTLVYSYRNGPRITINASELGNTKRLNFLVDSSAGATINPDTGDLDFSTAHADSAPDFGKGLWAYEVKVAPARLLLKSFSTSPRKPVAGKLFTVRLGVARSDTGALLSSGEVTCAARVAGAPLTPRTQKFVGKQAVCAWAIPGTARGKVLRGSVTVAFEGRRISKSFLVTIG
jgi:hypothetical protein